MIGKTVSHYRIIEKLGQGGMGEVYRAEGADLHRHVDIKVLPDEFAHDTERCAVRATVRITAQLVHATTDQQGTRGSFPRVLHG